MGGDFSGLSGRFAGRRTLSASRLDDFGPGQPPWKFSSFAGHHHHVLDILGAPTTSKSHSFATLATQIAVSFCSKVQRVQ